jgi:hypothetical protein
VLPNPSQSAEQVVNRGARSGLSTEVPWSQWINTRSLCVWHLAHLIDAALSDVDPGMAGAVFRTIRSPLSSDDDYVGGQPGAQAGVDAAQAPAATLAGATGSAASTTSTSATAADPQAEPEPLGPLLLTAELGVGQAQQGPDGQTHHGALVPHFVPLHVGESVRSASAKFCRGVLSSMGQTASTAGA